MDYAAATAVDPPAPQPPWPTGGQSAADQLLQQAQRDMTVAFTALAAHLSSAQLAARRRAYAHRLAELILVPVAVPQKRSMVPERGPKRTQDLAGKRAKPAVESARRARKRLLAGEQGQQEGEPGGEGEEMVQEEDDENEDEEEEGEGQLPLGDDRDKGPGPPGPGSPGGSDMAGGGPVVAQEAVTAN